MIKIEDLTPDIYYKRSRDFQFIGRLYDIVLNSVKTNVDLLYQLPIGINSSLESTDLLATTLGFTPRNKYNADQLKSVCSVLPLIMKNKGSLKAIQILINAILNVEGITDILKCEVNNETNTLVIAIPDKLTDLTLVYDLLDYLIPAGMSCEIIKTFTLSIPVETKVEYSDVISIYKKEIYLDDKGIIEYGSLPNLSDPATIDQIATARVDDMSGISIHVTTSTLEKETTNEEGNN